MVEPQIVVLDVAGSSPVDHPSLRFRQRKLSLKLKFGHLAKLPLRFWPWPNFGFRVSGAKRPMDLDFRGQTSIYGKAKPVL